MLSICITTHNNNLESLINRLLEQCNLLDIKTEICIADASFEPVLQEINSAIAASTGARYYKFSSRATQGKMKNHLALKAQYPYLLFVNGNMYITHKKFLQNYAEVMQPGLVINGGLTAIGTKPQQEFLLHWQAMHDFYTHDADVRTQFPYFYLSMNNLLIPRGVFLQHPMPESGNPAELLNYFFDLKQIGLPIIHIDNPLSTKTFITNKRFLATERVQLKAMNTWVKEKWEKHKTHIDLPEQSHLRKLERWRLLKIFKTIYAIQTKKMVRNAGNAELVNFKHYRNFRRWLLLKEDVRNF